MGVQGLWASKGKGRDTVGEKQALGECRVCGEEGEGRRFLRGTRLGGTSSFRCLSSLPQILGLGLEERYWAIEKY